MKNKVFSVVTKFMEWVGKVGERGVAYRGLADSDWDVAASIYGRLKENKVGTVHSSIFLAMTQRLLARARAEGHDIENHRQLPDLELLAKLQHYGAATCLIDFTRNPLIALWFACQLPEEKTGKVVAFDSGNTDLCREIPAQDLNKSIDTWLPVDVPNERLWVLSPKKMENRIIAQNSIFVLGTGVIAQEKLVSKENFLVKDKSAVLEELAMHGITAESLFCDFVGFAQQNSRNAKYHNWAMDNDFMSGLICQESGDNEEAIKFYDKAIKSNPQDAAAYNNRGIANYKLSHYEDAIADYDRTIELNPQDAVVYNNRGNAKKASGDLTSAIADFDRAIEINPQLAGAYYNRGLAKGKSGDLSGAIADFDRAIEITPQHSDSYDNRGLVKRKSGDYKSAIADFNRAIKINPQSAAAYNNRGLAKEELGDYKSAIADFDRALEINPQLASAHYNRGIAKGQSGDLSGAIADYDQAIKINPQSAAAYNNRGLTKEESGDYKSAIADFNRAIKINPQSAAAYHNRGIAKGQSGDYKSAIVDFNRAIKINPQLMSAYHNRGVVKEKSGDKEGAAADFRKAEELKNSPQP